MVAGADPHFPNLRECGALGCGVGCFGEGNAHTSGGGAVNGAVLVDGYGNVFGAVGSADDVGRVGVHVDAHENGVVDVAVLLEPNGACALEDAVDPHGCVEKNGGLHDGAFCLWWRFLLVALVYHAHAPRVYTCRCLALVGVLGVGVLRPRTHLHIASVAI